MTGDAAHGAADADARAATGELVFDGIARAYGAYRLEMERALQSVGLEMRTWRVLLILSEQGGSTLTELAVHALAKLTTVAKVVQRLEAQGRVQVSTSPHDARATVVALTDAGRDCLARSHVATQPLFERAFDGLGRAQLERLNRSLQRVLEHLR